MAFKIGEIYKVYFPENNGSVQGGWRPAVIFQNNLGNKFSPNLIVIPLTTKLKKTSQVTHVVLDKSCGLPQTSMALCENPYTVTKENVGEYVTTLSDEDLQRVAEGNLLAMAGIAFIQSDQLTKIIQKAKQLNTCVA